jgi:hypothetical protein
MDKIKKNSRSEEVMKTVFLMIIIITVFLFLIPQAAINAQEPEQTSSIKMYQNSTGGSQLEKNAKSLPDGIDAVTCAAFGPIPAVVEGPTVLEFWWRGSQSGIMFFTINGSVKATMTGDNGWQKINYIIKEAGPQMIKWVYKAANKA